MNLNAAHLHLLINHLPIFGAFLSLPLLLIAWWRRAEKGVLLCAVTIIVLASIGAGLSYLTGEKAQDIVTGMPTVSMKAMAEHEDRAETATVVMLVIGVAAVVLQVREWKRTTPPANWVFIALIAAMLIANAVVAWTALEGGMIRHSEVRPVESTSPDGG